MNEKQRNELKEAIADQVLRALVLEAVDGALCRVDLAALRRAGVPAALGGITLAVEFGAGLNTVAVRAAAEWERPRTHVYQARRDGRDGVEF